MNKKTLILLLLGVVLCLNLRAQNNAMNYLNAQLRAYFSPLTPPTPSKPFLYDMAAHVTDSVFFGTLSIDTLETDMWYKVYEEMFHSAYDTSWVQPIDDVWNRGNSFFPDTVPIGIMNFTFYKLKKDAMTTGNYFNFDTINDILSDKYPRANEPYIDSNMFAAAPMVPSCHFLNPIFRIDPQLIYFDAFNSGLFDPTKNELRIDFGDGHGEIVFDPTVVTNYQVNYHNEGEHIIHTAIYDGRGVLIEKSTSNISVISAVANVPPDQTFDFPGIRAGLYSGCNTTGLTGKTVIYLEGFDMLDFIPSLSRNASEIYSTMISTDNVVQLKNQGYSFLIVDWKNSRIDMRFNSLYLFNLIEYLKCNISDEEQFVIMGESMGGVIGRYTLSYMESTTFYVNNNNPPNLDPFFEDEQDPNNQQYLEIFGHQMHNLPNQLGDRSKMHNTRLLITIDSPHQGANIPMSIQTAYKTVMGLFGDYIAQSLKKYTTSFNLFIDGQAAQQLLIFHIDTKSGPSSCHTYSSCADKAKFFNQLQGLGNYPSYAKVVALSNGSLLGENQTNYYTGIARTPNDRLLEFEARLFARVLWHKINVFRGNLNANTNSNGCDQIFSTDLGWYGIKLKLKKFGIKITQTYHSILNVTETANLKPFCTAAGGYTGDPTYISNQPSSNSYNLSTKWYLNFFHYTHTVSGNGCVTFDSHLGFNGFASINFDYRLCSDGLQFCIIPTASALDYGNILTNGFPYNISNDVLNNNGINLMMNKPSVIIGYPDQGSYQNFNHLGFRNPLIRNITQQLPSTPFGQYIYFSCINATEAVRRTLLSLEIGDEELYLENAILHWPAEYEAEWAIHTNDMNPYYYYYGSSSNLIIPGCYSKYQGYNIDNIGWANFYYNLDNAVPNSGPFLNNIGPRYTPNDQVMNVCCLDFIGKNTPISLINNPTSTDNYLKIYPNPNTNLTADLDFKFKTAGSYVRMEIVSALGNNITTRDISSSCTTDATVISINLTQMRLNPGIYLVRLTNGNEILSTKLIIQ